MMKWGDWISRSPKEIAHTYDEQRMHKEASTPLKTYCTCNTDTLCPSEAFWMPSALLCMQKYTWEHMTTNRHVQVQQIWCAQCVQQADDVGCNLNHRLFIGSLGNFSYKMARLIVLIYTCIKLQPGGLSCFFRNIQKRNNQQNISSARQGDFPDRLPCDSPFFVMTIIKKKSTL